MEGSEPDQRDPAPAWVTLGKFHNLCFLICQVMHRQSSVLWGYAVSTSYTAATVFNNGNTDTSLSMGPTGSLGSVRRGLGTGHHQICGFLPPGCISEQLCPRKVPT